MFQTREQFVQKYLHPVDVESHLQSATEVFSGSNITCPSSLDWRSMGFVTDVSLFKDAAKFISLTMI